jgi:uncharacterized protein YqgC (DUF456 family)
VDLELMWLMAGLLVLAGLAGLFLPGLPGPPLIFAGLLFAAWGEDFAYVGAGTLVAIGALGALTYAVDFIAAACGARRFGASRRAALGAVIGAAVGLFFGLPGILLGPFLGALLAELSRQRTLQEASRAGIGATLGLIVGLAVKLTLALAMVGLFALDRFVWAGPGPTAPPPPEPAAPLPAARLGEDAPRRLARPPAHLDGWQGVELRREDLDPDGGPGADRVEGADQLDQRDVALARKQARLHRLPG